MYQIDTAADARAARLIRFLIAALLALPLLCCSCATSLSAADGPRHEQATPTRLTARK